MDRQESLMALRRADGFIRYALAIQYHGTSFLGFSFQGSQENAILDNGTDLRGIRTVEGRLREALSDLVGHENFENIQVSSRTDRGVHALKNTCHVDIRPRNKLKEPWEPDKLERALNYHLSRQRKISLTFSSSDEEEHGDDDESEQEGDSNVGDSGSLKSMFDDPPVLHARMNEFRILGATTAPALMKNNLYGLDESQPEYVDWNARYSATERTYIYRILEVVGNNSTYAIPFEWDTSWRLAEKRKLRIDRMNEGASYLIGTHDFTSFRGSHCQRLSPVVTLKEIRVTSQPYGMSYGWELDGGLLGLGTSPETSPNHLNLITIRIKGDSFVNRQVRNIVGCLVDVGRGRLEPIDVQRLLVICNRAHAPATAPAQGLFLAHVQHGDFSVH